MSDLSNLFHFFTIFNGDNMKDKIKDMESTYGNNDGTLTKGELKKAVEDNKALLELYGWDGYRDGNFDDLVDKWFAQMDTIKTNKNIKGTRYTETGAISAEEIEALSTKAENAGFINETGWVNLNNEYVEGIDDYETALTCKKFFEEYKEFYAQNEELILSLNGWDGAKDIVDCDLSTKAFLESFKTDKNVWVSTMNAIKQGLNISMTERVNDNLKLLKETQESFSCLLTQDKSFWEQVVDFAKDLWSTIKSWFTGEKETPKAQEKTVADYFNSIQDNEIQGLAELRAFINMDEEALLTYDIDNIPNLKATFEKVLLRCKQLEIEDKMILGFHDVLKESADKTPEELKTSVIEMIKTSLPDVYEKHSKEIDAIVSTAVNAISATDEKKWIQDIVSRIQKLYSGEMETELEITADNLPNYENIEALSKDNEDFEANKYVMDCLYELVSQEMPNLCAEYGNDIYNIIKSHELNLNDITDEQSYKTAVTTFFNSIKEDIVKFAQTNTDYTAIKSEVEDDYRWEFPTRAEGATIEYSKELPKWNVIEKANDNTRKELIKNAVIGIVKARIPESYEILKGDIFDAKFDELYKNIKFDENKTAYYRSSANMVNDLLAALKTAVQENITAHDKAKQTVKIKYTLATTLTESSNSAQGVQQNTDNNINGEEEEEDGDKLTPEEIEAKKAVEEAAKLKADAESLKAEVSRYLTDNADHISKVADFSGLKELKTFATTELDIKNITNDTLTAHKTAYTTLKAEVDKVKAAAAKLKADAESLKAEVSKYLTNNAKYISKVADFSGLKELKTFATTELDMKNITNDTLTAHKTAYTTLKAEVEKIKALIKSVDFKNEDIMVEMGSGNKVKVSDLFKSDNHTVIYGVYYRRDKLNDIKNSALGIIEYCLDNIVTALAGNPNLDRKFGIGYDYKRLVAAAQKTYNYYDALMTEVNKKDWGVQEWKNKEKSGEYTISFESDGKSYTETVYRQNHEKDNFEEYNTGRTNDCGVQLLVDCDFWSKNNACIAVDVSKVIQKFYEFAMASI